MYPAAQSDIAREPDGVHANGAPAVRMPWRRHAADELKLLPASRDCQNEGARNRDRGVKNLSRASDLV